MLRTRVITALALMPLVLGMLFLANRPVWAAFALAIALISCWEWSRMCGFTKAGQTLYLAASGAIGAYLWLLSIRIVPGNFTAAALTGFIIATVFWIAIVPAWLAKKARPNSSSCAVAGWIVVWPTFLALIVLREVSPWLLLALAALVWVADIAAYFSGRRFGKRKLAPAVSPNKTWEGVYGALVGVILYGLIICAVAGYDEALTRVFAPSHGIPALIAMAGLAGVSILGDLYESWMKRGAGLKDSSQLLPGHGGILDRIDALTSTLPIASLLILVAAR